MGENVANINVKTLQELFTRSGKLLHRIHNRHFIFNTQIIKQFAVSFLMYSRLKSTKVDGDSIGNIVIQSFYDTFPWAHCLFMCHLLSHLVFSGNSPPLRSIPYGRCAPTYRPCRGHVTTGNFYLPSEAI